MAEIVRQGDRFGEVLVEAQRARQGPRDARDLDGVGHPRPVMIARAVEKDLGLVLEAAKGTTVDDPISVALKIEPKAVLVLGVFASAGGGAVLRVGREMTGLISFKSKRRRGIASTCHLTTRDSTESFGLNRRTEHNSDFHYAATC